MPFQIISVFEGVEILIFKLRENDIVCILEKIKILNNFPVVSSKLMLLIIKLFMCSTLELCFENVQQ